MYLNCPTCDKPVNANYISYCVTCFNDGSVCSLFLPSDERLIRAAEYEVSLTTKSSKNVIEEGIEVEEAPQKRFEWAKVKQSRLALVGTLLIVMALMGVIVWRALPFIFPERYVDKDKEVLNNMLNAKVLVMKYHKKHKKFPKSIGEVITPGSSVISIKNPFTGATEKGVAWADYGTPDMNTITPGMIVYERRKNDFEITGFGDKGIQITLGGLPFVVNKETQSDVLEK